MNYIESNIEKIFKELEDYFDDKISKSSKNDKKLKSEKILIYLPLDIEENSEVIKFEAN